MNNKRLIFAFTGASGTGKSTLLKLIEQELKFKCVELSGRPYLPSVGDYVTNASDSINRRISYGSLVTMTGALLDFPGRDIFFSRSAVDRLAYGRTLNVGADLHDIIVKEIEELTIPYVKVFYLPVEFEIPSTENDEVRGKNDQVRRDTDYNIRAVMNEFHVPYTVVKGTVEQRMEIIKREFKLLRHI